MGSGGAIREVSVDGRIFAVAADADITIKLGGQEVESMANGDGSARKILTPVPWSLEGLQLVADSFDGGHEFLQNIANSPAEVAITVTEASGATWQGDGSISGALAKSTGTALISCDMSGTGVLTRQ